MTMLGVKKESRQRDGMGEKSQKGRRGAGALKNSIFWRKCRNLCGAGNRRDEKDERDQRREFPRGKKAKEKAESYRRFI
jgi:hypothetical protein